MGACRPIKIIRRFARLSILRNKKGIFAKVKYVITKKTVMVAELVDALA